MNIEEKSAGNGIINAGPFPRHFHLSESDRGTPGQGCFDWDEIFAVLGSKGFNDSLTMKTFINMPPELAYGLAACRPVLRGCDGPRFTVLSQPGLSIWPYSRPAGSTDGTSDRAVTSSVMKVCGRSERSAALRMSIFSRPPDRSTRCSTLDRRSSGIEMER